MTTDLDSTLVFALLRSRPRLVDADLLPAPSARVFLPDHHANVIGPTPIVLPIAVTTLRSATLAPSLGCPPAGHFSHSPHLNARLGFVHHDVWLRGLTRRATRPTRSQTPIG